MSRPPKNKRELLRYHARQSSFSLNELACQFDIQDALKLIPEEYEIAGAYGAIGCLERLLRKRVPDSYLAYCGAAATGKLCTLRWLREQNIPKPVEAYNFALERRNITAADWLLRNGFKRSSDPYYFAAIRGDLEAMKWLYRNGFEKPNDLYSYAIQSGELEILEWMYQKNFPTGDAGCDPYVSAIVHHGGSIPIIEWLLAHNFPKWSGPFWYAMNNEFLDLSEESRLPRKLEILELLHRHHFPWDDYIIGCAIRLNSTFLIEWLLNHGFEINKYVCMSAYETAIKKKNIPMLNWLHNHGFEPSPDGFVYGAMVGDLEILEWLKDHNFEKNSTAYCFAVKKQSLVTIEWLYANEFPLTRSITGFVVKYGTTNEIKEWLCIHGVPISLSSR